MEPPTNQIDAIAEDTAETIDFTHAGQTFRMRKRFKRLRFLRLLQEDPTKAIEMAFGPEEYARIEDMEMTDEEFRDFLSAFAARFAGGNSSASPR